MMINLKECNEVLAQYKGQKAKIWSFDNTFGRLVLRLWEFDQLENRVKREAFLVIASCEFLNGPFLWDNVDLFVTQSNDSHIDETQYEVVDRNSGFKLIATGGVSIQ